MSKTLDYYNENAKTFIQGTVDVEFHETQDKFLALLPKEAKILDFGCGSGRDTKYFLMPAAASCTSPARRAASPSPSATTPPTTGLP